MDANDDDESKKQKMYLALSDCYYNLQKEFDQHWSFLDKADTIVEKAKAGLQEMAELIKNKFMNKQGKESEMDAVEKKKFEDEIASLNAKVKEFTEEKEEQNKLALEAQAKANDERIRSQVKEFMESDENKGLKKKLEDMKFDVIAFNLIKTTPEIEFSDGKKSVFDILKGFVKELPKPDFKEARLAKDEIDLAKKYSKGKGIFKPEDFQEIQKAHKYFDEHKADYKNFTEQQALASILLDAGLKKITL